MPMRCALMPPTPLKLHCVLPANDRMQHHSSVSTGIMFLSHELCGGTRSGFDGLQIRGPAMGWCQCVFLTPNILNHSSIFFFFRAFSYLICFLSFARSISLPLIRLFAHPLTYSHRFLVEQVFRTMGKSSGTSSEVWLLVWILLTRSQNLQRQIEHPYSNFVRFF